LIYRRNEQEVENLRRASRIDLVCSFFYVQNLPFCVVLSVDEGIQSVNLRHTYDLFGENERKLQQTFHFIHTWINSETDYPGLQ